MATRKQRRRQSKLKEKSPRTKVGSVGQPRSPRPTPVQAIESLHRELAERLGKRRDRYSQLLAKSFADERGGQVLITRSGLTEDEVNELRALAGRAHAEFRAELDSATETLRELLRRGDPLHTVAVVQMANLMTPWGEYYEPTARGGENRVELVAGIVASQPPVAGAPPLSDDEMELVFEELSHIADLHYLVNLTARGEEEGDADPLRFLSAMHWINLRGTSFGNHGRELAEVVFAPFDQWMVERYGFTISDAIELSDAVEQMWAASVNAAGERAADFANRVSDALADRESLPAAVQRNIRTDEDREAAARYALYDAFRSSVRAAATFTLRELLAIRPELDRDRAAAVLDELSLEVGGIEPTEYSGLFDPSPLVERPFLRHDDRYMLPVPGMLLRDIFTVFDARLMRERPGYSKSRARTLDRLAVEWIGKMLPGAVAYTNLHYGQDELDGLVLFEKTAFVVEGKASAISFQARRGDVKRLINEIGRSVEAAFEQGVRARDYLFAPGDAVFSDDRGVEVLRVAEGTVEDVQIINPTIHELGGHAPQLTRFRKRGLFQGGELPWSVYINDLRVIAETCENAAVFLHYLVWRSRLALGEQVIVLDELDLWGAYLLCARFPPLGPNGHHQLGNSTTDFDAYYDGITGRGPKRDPPRKLLEEPARSFVSRMAAERPTGWREAAGVILDLSIPELVFVCVKAKEASRAATSGGGVFEARFGRGVLIGVPRGMSLEAVLAHAAKKRNDASFFIYATSAGGKHGSLLWATYGREISLDLSDFEKRMDAAMPSAFQDETSLD